MINLVDHNGNLKFGLRDTAVETVNYADYPLRTPMGIRIPKFLRKLCANQFIFCGICGPDLMLGMAVVDLKYTANGFFYIYNRKTLEINEIGKISLPFKAHIGLQPDNLEACFSSKKLKITFQGEDLKVEVDQIDFKAELNVKLDLNKAEPLRLCSRAGYRGWVYTQKTSPLRINGEIIYNKHTYCIKPPEWMGLLDWTAGYMRRETCWNWAAIAATLPDGTTLGLNLSCGVNESGFTENAFWINGNITKVDTINFIFNPENMQQEWQIRSFDDKVDLIFKPEGQRGEKFSVLLVATKFTQLMGTFRGRLLTPDRKIEINNCPGWVEDHYAKW